LVNKSFARKTRSNGFDKVDSFLFIESEQQLDLLRKDSAVNIMEIVVSIFLINHDQDHDFFTKMRILLTVFVGVYFGLEKVRVLINMSELDDDETVERVGIEI